MADGGKSGPRTERGKAAVRLNPIKHGVLSQTPVIPLVEREEDWEKLRKGIFEYYDPQGMMEEVLAHDIASLAWRGWRAVRMETESISAYLEAVPEDYRRSQDSATSEGPDHQDVAEMDRMIAARLLPGAETMDKELRYETKIHRFMLQKTHQLLVLQAIRKGSETPPSSLKVRSARVRKLRVTETRSGTLVGLANRPRPSSAAPRATAPQDEHDERNVGAQHRVRSGGAASSTALLDSTRVAVTHRAEPVGAQHGVKSDGAASSTALLDSTRVAATRGAALAEGDWDAEAEEEEEPALVRLILRDGVGQRGSSPQQARNRAERRRRRRGKHRRC